MSSNNDNAGNVSSDNPFITGFEDQINEIRDFLTKERGEVERKLQQHVTRKEKDKSKLLVQEVGDLDKLLEKRKKLLEQIGLIKKMFYGEGDKFSVNDVFVHENINKLEDKYADLIIAELGSNYDPNDITPPIVTKIAEKISDDTIDVNKDITATKNKIQQITQSNQYLRHQKNIADRQLVDNETMLNFSKSIGIINGLEYDLAEKMKVVQVQKAQYDTKQRQLQQQINDLQNKNSNIIDKNSEDYKNNIALIEKNKEVIKNLQEDNNNLNFLVKEGKKRIVELDDLKTTLQNQLAISERNKNAIQSNYDNAVETIKLEKEKNAKLTSAQIDLMNKLTLAQEALANNNNNFGDEKSELEKKLAAQSELLRTNIARTEQLKNNFESRKKELEDKNAIIYEGYANNIKELEQNHAFAVNELNTKIKELEEELKSATDNSDEIMADLTAVRGDLANLRQLYDAEKLRHEREAEEAAETVNAKNEQYNAAKQDYEESQQRLIKANSEFDDLKKIYDDLVQKHLERNTELQNKIAEYQEAINVINESKQAFMDVGEIDDPKDLVIEDVFAKIMNKLKIPEDSQDKVLDIVKRNVALNINDLQQQPGAPPLAQNSNALKNLVNRVTSDTLNDIKKLSNKIDFESTKDRQRFQQQFDTLRNDIEREKSRLPMRQYTDLYFPEKKFNLSDIVEKKKEIPIEDSGDGKSDKSNIYILAIQVFETEKGPFNKIPLSESSGNIDSILLKYPSNIIKHEIGSTDNPAEDLLINTPVLPCKYQYYEVGTDSRYIVDVGDIVDNIYRMNEELPDFAANYLHNNLIDEDDYNTIISVYKMKDPGFDYYDEIHRIFYERSKIRWNVDEFKSGTKQANGLQFILSDQVKQQGYVKHVCINDKIERDKYYYFVAGIKGETVYNDLLGFNNQQADNDAKLEIIDAIKYQANYYKGIRRMYALSVYYNDHNKRKLTNAIGATVNDKFKTLGILENIIILKDNNIKFKMPNLKKQTGKIVSIKNIDKIYDEIYDKMNAGALTSLKKMRLIPIPAEYSVLTN